MRFARGLLLSAFFVLAAFSVAAGEPKRVLILSCGGGCFWDVGTGLREQLAAQYRDPLEFHEAALEPCSVGVQSDEPLAKYLEGLFAGHKPDLVIACGSPAIGFTLGKRARIFPGTPLLLAAVDHRRIGPLDLDTNCTAVDVHFDLQHVINSAVQVWPTTTNIVVVLGNTAREAFWKREMKREFRPLTNHIAFSWTDDLSLVEMRHVLHRLPPQSLIFYFSLLMDGAGVPHEHVAALKSIHEVANAPIIGLFGSDLGNGIAGGPLISVRRHIGEVTRVAMRILHGESPGSIRTAPLRAGDPVYDWGELQHWGVQENQLPSGSDVQFRGGLWPVRDILGISAFCLLEAALIIWLVYELRRRLRTERSLRESEEQLAVASEAGGTGLWSMRIDTGQIWVTPRMRELLQFGPEEELNFEKFLQAVHPEDRELILQAAQQTFATGAEMRIEHRVALRDGGVRWISGRGRAYGDAHGKRNRVTGASVDITERVQAEQALRASEEGIKLAVSAAELAIWDWDMVSDRIRTTGMTERYPPSAFDYARFLETVHPEDRSTVTEALVRARNGLGDYELVYRAIFADGSTHWIASRGRMEFNGQHKPIRMRGVSLDITRRKQAEERIQESERRFSLVANAAPVLIWVSGPDKKCTFFNKPWLEFTGRTLEQELGDGWVDGVHQDDVAGCIKVYLESFDARQPFTMEYRLRYHDGQYRWLLDHGVPRYDPEGNFAGYIGSCVDVTERKLAEAEAQRARQELEHVNRVSTLGELAGSLAHELNQPLTAILSNAQAAQHALGNGNGGADLGAIRSILTDIVEEDRRASEVISRMRGMLRKGQSKVRALDLNRVVLEVLTLLHSEMVRQSMSAKTVLARSLPLVLGDRIQLQQVLINLVMNACDAMHGNLPHARMVTVETQTLDARHVQVAVSDLGPGFAPGSLKFEPFRTSKPNGLGLGLVICRSIISAHGGSLELRNKPQGGAVVTFTLLTHQKETQ